jgi:hypothetical protein
MQINVENKIKHSNIVFLLIIETKTKKNVKFIIFREKKLKGIKIVK